MGRYINWADVSARYPGLPKTVDAPGAEQSLIPHAEAEVDGRLAVKYTVPFSPAPYLVRDLAIDVAYYKVIFGSDRAEELKRYIDQRFEGILNGTLVLTTSDGPVAQSGAMSWASNSYHSMFGLDDEVNWNVDRQALEDAQDARDR